MEESQAQANANLFAAGPNLVSVCQKMYDFIYDNEISEKYPEMPISELMDAIDKARGES